MKKLLVSVAFCFAGFFAFAQSSKWFTIKAFLPQWNGAEVSVFCNEKLLFSNRVRNDIFAFNGHIEASQQAVLKISDAEKRNFYIPFFLEPGTIKIRDAGNRLLVPYGTPSNDLYFSLNKTFDSLAALQKNSSFSEAVDFKRTLATNFVRNNPASIVSVQLLRDYYYLATDANDSLYYMLVHSLDNAFQDFSYVKEMMREADTRYITAVGQPAPVAELFDSNGNKRCLFSKGEYTLIDFWASWCVPCRRENPALLKVFKKYQSAGFTISGVSLDVNKNRWLNAIKQDQLAWPQLCDLNGWKSAVVSTYGIKLIPMNYLINKEGVIIARNLHAAQLDGLLNTLLSQRTSETKTDTQPVF